MKSLLTKFISFAIIIIWSITACQQTKELTSESDQRLANLDAVFDTSAVFSSNFTGFALYDPARGKMLYGQNEHRYFTPASNTKLFTFYTGLELLPDSLKGVEYVTRGDSLIFWGTGDPSFLHPEFGNGKVYRFLKQSNKKLFFSDANFHDKRLGPGWAWSDYNYYYQPEKSPFPMYGNVVRVETRGRGPNERLSIEQKLSVSPDLFYSKINEVSSDNKEKPILHRQTSGNEFEYHSSSDTVAMTLYKPYHYTPELITKMLSDTLGKSVTYLPKEKPDSTNTVYSILADTAYKRMLKPSDNFIAEQLLLVAASEIGDTLKSSLVIDKMQNSYLEMLPQEPQWVDGSGLSRYNMFTPSSIIWLLKQIDDEFKTDAELFELLAAGGESGTIRNWYGARDGGPAYIFAKTGTLSNNHSLSGFIITDSGRKLIFSFMNNHYVSSSSAVKEEMEKVLWYIHTHF